MLVIRSEGALLYFNVDHVRDRLVALLSERSATPRLVVLFMGNVPHIDLAGAEFLAELRAMLLKRGIEFRLAEARGQVREALRRLGNEGVAELAEANQTVDDVLGRWRVALHEA